MRITSAYSSIANGGFIVSPRIIDVIYDNSGKIIFKGDKRKCVNCSFESVDNLTDPRHRMIYPSVQRLNEQRDEIKALGSGTCARA